uniref:Uncharacterized protein n=1 Tax=Anopheles albimanus TaxID=7167 RepID=A0A182FXM8_ANOAL
MAAGRVVFMVAAAAAFEELAHATSIETFHKTVLRVREKKKREREKHCGKGQICTGCAGNASVALAFQRRHPSVVTTI